MGSSGSQQQAPTQTVTQSVSPQQQALIDLAMPGVQKFAATTLTPPAQSVVGFDPSQTAGQEQVLGAVPTQQGLAQTAASATGNIAGGGLNSPETNAMLRSAITAATDPIYEQLTRQALPAIRSEAQGVGPFGGSRQGIAEGLAISDADKLAGRTAATMSSDLYKTNIDAQLKALGLVPTIQTAQVTPGLTTSGVGDVRQAQAQRELDAANQASQFQQYAPFLQSKEIMALASGLPGQTVTATGSNPPPGPTAQQALGGAAAGATLGSLLFPGVGTAAGALGGAALPFLFR